MSFVAPTAVLFDLDDTLSDLLGCVRAGVIGTAARHAATFAGVPTEQLEALHSEILEETHVRVLAGEVTMAAARVERTQRFFAAWGVELDPDEAEAEYLHYRQDYDAAGGVVRGTYELLDAIDALGVRMGIITNNLVAEQHRKLRSLDLFDRFEMLAISEEVGVPKPDPHIFNVALDRMSLGTDDVVMVGDSLTSDVAGALGVGIATVWLDRHGHGPGVAPAELQAVVTGDWTDTDAAVAAILG